MYQYQFKALKEATSKNRQLLIAQLILKEKPDSIDTNNANSSKIQIINISHIPPFVSFDTKKDKL